MGLLCVKNGVRVQLSSHPWADVQAQAVDGTGAVDMLPILLSRAAGGIRGASGAECAFRLDIFDHARDVTFKPHSGRASEEVSGEL